MTTLTPPTPTLARVRHVPRLIERFITQPDITEVHETLIDAPAELVMQLAREMDFDSLPVVRAMFRMREKLLGSTPDDIDRPRGLVARTRSLGWGTLAVRPGREYVAGAVAQPWKADVAFHSVPGDEFAAFAEPDLVKIVWTLEAEPLGPERTRFRTETRAVATDAGARAKFLRYWRWAGLGVVLIRWLMLPALKRQAERLYAGRGR